jgi:hypothetical protein
MLRGLGIGARHDHAPVAVVRPGAPDLLSVEHPAVALAHGARAQPGEIASGVGLAEELAPDHLAARHLAQVAALLRLRAVGEDRGPEHAVADRVEARRRVEARLFLIPDHLLHAAEVLAAELLRPAETCPALIELLGLPRLRARDHGVVLAVCAEQIGGRRFGIARLRVALEPRARARAEGRFLRSVVEVHRRLLDRVRGAKAGAVRAAQASARASRRCTSFSRHALGVPSHAESSFARRRRGGSRIR